MPYIVYTCVISEKFRVKMASVHLEVGLYVDHLYSTSYVVN